jgi:DNA polymerase I-like protein with 3'-5' exonuclease and polymerase domains
MRLLINKVCSLEETVELIHQPHPVVGVDTEFFNLDNRLPLGIGVAISKDTAFYFFDTKDKYAHQLIDNASIVLMHNCAADIPLLSKLGYTIKGYEDTMLIVYSAGILQKRLSQVAPSLLGKANPSVTTLWSKKDQGNIGVSHVKLGQLCMTHACNTYALWEIVPITRLYKDIDKPSLELVMEMERWGILIDQYKLTQLEQETLTRAEQLEKDIKEALGDININSNPQLAKALQDKGIIGTRKTKSAKISTSKQSLKPLDNPIANKVLQWRSDMNKTVNTYIKEFRNVDGSGRLHTKFGYTNTGRFSSSNPNLQNITRDERFQLAEEEDE